MEFIRSFRIGPFAIFDFTISYVAMYFLAPYLSKLFRIFGLRISREQWLWLTLPIALITHLILGLHTPLTKMFLNLTGNFTTKLVVLFMLFMAYWRRGR